jgi:hypothetical protein
VRKCLFTIAEQASISLPNVFLRNAKIFLKHKSSESCLLNFLELMHLIAQLRFVIGGNQRSASGSAMSVKSSSVLAELSEYRGSVMQRDATLLASPLNVSGALTRGGSREPPHRARSMREMPRRSGRLSGGVWRRLPIRGGVVTASGPTDALAVDVGPILRGSMRGDIDARTPHRGLRYVGVGGQRLDVRRYCVGSTPIAVGPKPHAQTFTRNPICVPIDRFRTDR